MAKNLEARIQYIEDFIEIDQLMHKYAHFLLRSELQKIVDCFAQKDPDISVEIADSGIYKGMAGVKRMYLDLHWSQHSTPGFMGSVLIHNPWIEIHPNGKEAKGMWTNVNLVTKPTEGKLTPCIVHGRYNNTLIKEDGVWRWEKFHWMVIFRTSLLRGWVDQPITGGMTSAEFPSDGPTTFYQPYNPSVFNKFDPPPPEPYE